MKINLNGYKDPTFVTKSDLFIDKYGLYYQVKKTISKSKINHNIWANYYLNEQDKEKKLSLDIFSNNYLSDLNIARNNNLSPSEILIHKDGFLYYSHDEILYKPIIIVANPKYYGIRATEEQLDSLFEIMMLNGENPFLVPMLMGEENIYDYVEEERGKVYEKKLY